MIPKEILKTYDKQLRQGETMPNQWLGDWAAQYLKDLKNLSDHEQLLYVCGLMEQLYAIGLLEGKRRAVRAIEKIILEQNK